MIRKQMRTRRVAQEMAAFQKPAFTFVAVAAAAALNFGPAMAGTEANQAQVGTTGQPAEQYQAPEQAVPQQEATEQYGTTEQSTEQYGTTEQYGSTEQYSTTQHEQYEKSSGMEKSSHRASRRTLINNPSRPYRVSFSGELGLSGVLSHKLELGQSGTRLDMRQDAGQMLLNPFARIEGDISMHRHSLVMLYQPFSISSRVILPRDVVLDDLTFPRGTPVDVHFAMPFWRASYLYDFASHMNDEIALGFSLQPRNNAVDFTSADGSLRRARRSISVMPSLKFRAKHTYSNGVFVGAEADALYATIPVLNGTLTNHVRGLMIDTSLKAGVKLRPGLETFLSLRYIGSGAEGNLSTNPMFNSGFSSNWLHVLALSVGINVM